MPKQPKSGKRIVLSVQYYDGGVMPTNFIRTHEVAAGMNLRSAAQFAFARLLEELPQEKDVKRHD